MALQIVLIRFEVMKFGFESVFVEVKVQIPYMAAMKTNI